MDRIEPSLTTLNLLPSGIITVDHQARVTFLNAAAETLIGWTAVKAVGQAIDRVLPLRNDQSQTITQSLVHDILKRGQPFQQKSSVNLRLADQTACYLQLQAAPICDDQGSIIGGIFICQDVTERVRREKDKDKYIVELEAFAHTVAHDLQHALSPVIGYAEVLETAHASIPDDELTTHLQAISRNGHRMRNIIDELLLLAGVRKKQVQMGALDMQSIVTNAQRRLNYMIQETNAEIIYPAHWPVALGYSPWVEEIWVNYISNGLKYGGQPPRLELGGQIEQQMARFWVQDNGRGLKPEEQTQLFTQFTQLSQVRADGHGLGLSIVQRIVERLQGQVGVESDGIEGRGSCFSFTLPLASEPTATNTTSVSQI